MVPQHEHTAAVWLWHRKPKRLFRHTWRPVAILLLAIIVISLTSCICDAGKLQALQLGHAVRRLQVFGAQHHDDQIGLAQRPNVFMKS
jgi:hypothetical protein